MKNKVIFSKQLIEVVCSYSRFIRSNTAKDTNRIFGGVVYRIMNKALCCEF